MKKPYPVLTIERPIRRGGIDFLDIGAHIKAEINRETGQMEITCTIDDEEGSSYFTCQDFVMDIPSLKSK